MSFTIGSRLRYRGLFWDVMDVEPSGAQTRLRLRCTQGDLTGMEWDALHPWDVLEPQEIGFRPSEPATLRDWWLHHVALWHDTPRHLQPLVACGPGRVTPEPWQLVPLLRALDMPRPRLLLADGVGLGKTVQAALIASELIQRRRAHRIIIVAPAGPLLAQWSEELRIRFGLRPTILADSASLRAAQRRLELGGNPFDATSLCLTSLDFAKQDAVLGELDRSCWDLAIIDEAHHCFGDAGMMTHRRKLAEVLSRRADGLLLLTATPHDGDDAHFASLIALLDPLLVDGNGRLIGQDYRRHVVRRLKAHVRDQAGGATAFRQRVITPLPVTLSGAASDFHQALARLMAPRLHRATRGSGPTDVLAFISLLKRACSTIAASIRTLTVVADRYASLAGDGADGRRERRRRLLAYHGRTRRYGVLTAAEERAQAELEAEDIATGLRSAAGHDTAEALRAVIRLGEAARSDDPKLRALTAAIRSIRKAEPTANIIVYTEYADSLDAVRDTVRRDPEIGTVLTISGSDSDEFRARATDRFATEDNLVLISTDSLAEGLNLQRRCHHLIHLDLPYNPNRLEQRNGRIDRYGQTRDPEIRYLYLSGTFEERLLLRLIAKYERARTELAFMPNTLGVTADDDALTSGLVQGFAEDQIPLFPPPPSVIRTLDHEAQAHHAYRALEREISRAYGGFEGHAMQHGWWDGGGAALTAPVRAGPHAPVARSVTDMITTPLEFLVHAMAAARGTVDCDPASGDAVCALPPHWMLDLAGLPGADPDGRRFRLTSDPDRFRDAAGHALACPGWSHPLVRHALDHFRIVPDEGHDTRVAVAVGSSAAPEAVLTYAVDYRSAMPGPPRLLVAVRMTRTGKPRVEAEPSRWLRLDRPCVPDPRHAWDRHFAHWLPSRLVEAGTCATLAAQRAAETALRHHDTQRARGSALLERWLARRVDQLCGPATPLMADLFAPAPGGSKAGATAAPLDRLDALIRDPRTQASTREEAEAVRSMARERRHQLALPGPTGVGTPMPLGLLLLLPHA